MSENPSKAAVEAAIRAKGVAQLGQAGYAAAVQNNAALARSQGISVSDAQVAAAISAAKAAAPASSSGSSTLGGTSAAASVSHSSGGGVTIESTSGQSAIITSGPYAGMTPQQRKDAVEASIEAKGVSQYGADQYASILATRSVAAVNDGRATPAQVAEAFNRSGISSDLAISSLQAASQAKTGAVSPTLQPQVYVTQDDTPLQQPAIPYLPAVDLLGSPAQSASNYVSGAFDSASGLLHGAADDGQTTTQPAPGTKTVGVVSGGMGWILGLVLVAGLVAVLVRKLRRKKGS